jgi:hypothetical protein
MDSKETKSVRSISHDGIYTDESDKSRINNTEQLCFSSGQGIQPVYLEYNHDSLVRQSMTTLNCPIQGKPDEAGFKIWRRYIKMCFMDKENKRVNPLGAWDIKEVIQISHHQGYFSNANKEIYIYTNKQNTISLPFGL